MNCFPDPDKHYYMFYKPFGYVTAHRDDLFPVVMDYFSELHNDRLSPVGRLDRETEGLLIVTDDGKWNQYMTNPEFHVPKTYEFAALGTLDARELQRLAEGVLLTGSDIPTKGADVTVTDTCVLSDILPLLHPIKCIQQPALQYANFLYRNYHLYPKPQRGIFSHGLPAFRRP